MKHCLKLGALLLVSSAVMAPPKQTDQQKSEAEAFAALMTADPGRPPGGRTVRLARQAARDRADAREQERREHERVLRQRQQGAQSSSRGPSFLNLFRGASGKNNGVPPKSALHRRRRSESEPDLTDAAAHVASQKEAQEVAEAVPDSPRALTRALTQRLQGDAVALALFARLQVVQAQTTSSSPHGASAGDSGTRRRRHHSRRDLRPGLETLRGQVAELQHQVAAVTGDDDKGDPEQIDGDDDDFDLAAALADAQLPPPVTYDLPPPLPPLPDYEGG